MKRRLFLAAAMVMPLALSLSGAAQAADNLSVLLPPWGTLPKDMTDKFAAERGVALDAQTLGWDDILTKIVTSSVAGTAPADATELDWSWIGRFGAAKWYVPLEDKIDPKIIADIPTASIFQYDGHLIGVTYSNDFRVLIYNKAHLAKANVAAAPKTPDELIATAKAVKAAKIAEFPIGLPLSATEGTSTAWYLLTKVFGGDLFDKDFKPLFIDPNSPGYKALNFEITALKDGLIDPAATGLKDVDVQELFKAGKITFDVAGWAGNMALYSDASKSQVANDVAAALMPSTIGKARTLGLPEAVGIPVKAANPKAAAAFIAWLLKPENEIVLYDQLGDMPARLSVLKQLNDSGKLKDGNVLLAQAALVEPLFTQGAPSWYPDFSTAVATIINQAAKDQISVDKAVTAIAKAAADAQAN
ncbi:extracellular solute-binding protein [Telmatospirillum sp.]|uniref:extracellular solute-binding protein n=1 Tax=Telmatospirillum sp. TaxID=2079197 RepID=UPI002845D682|nr:extracellular solute-binding protein [Telmatospirillum sp.]MDR3436212.1 extracellular solute-binding protein [Telmatospirillum sp.]